MFSLGGATFGMNEEIIPFVLILVPVAIALGYDSIIGVAIPLVGAHIGFASAFLNPFNVGIAQGIAEVPLFSGIGYRIISWAISTTVAILFLLFYIKRLSKDPKISPMYNEDQQRKLNEQNLSGNDKIFTKKHKLVLLTFLLSLIMLVVGVIEFGWYIQEIAGMFFIMGILVGIIGGLTGDVIIKSFIEGAKI